jgi:hypothetical protein
VRDTIIATLRRAGRIRHRAALAAVPVLLITAGTAGAAPGPAGGPSRSADSPGRHTAGLITVGMPNRTVAGVEWAGAVDVYPSSGPRQVLTQKSLGLTSVTGARFGASITMADLNHDQRTDLLIGVPGSPGLGTTGHVVIVLQSGSGTRFRAANARILKGPDLAGDEFGTAIAVSPRSTAPKVQDVWVGAPGRDLSALPDRSGISAGAVYHYVAAANGTITAAGSLSEGDSTIPGPAVADDRFGSVLASTVDGVVVGVPTRDVEGVIDAGQVVRVRLDRTTHDLLPAQVITQDTPGVAGTARENNRFGAAVTEHGYAVGIPNERVGNRQSAGAVQTFVDDPAVAGRLRPGVRLTQNSPGIPGAAEAGDRFGLTLSQNTFTCKKTLSLAIGSPDENVGTKKNAGSVTLVVIRPNPAATTPCPAKVLTQGHGLPGKPNAGDRLGAAVSSIDGVTTRDTLLVGIPGEDVGRYGNTGRAAIAHPWTSFSQGFGAQGGDVTARSYGSVLGTEAAG